MSRPSNPAPAVEALEGRQLMSTVVALSGRDTLLFVDSAAADVTLAKVRVRGLARRESLLGIDYRPANGQLYAIGSTAQLYQVNVGTGRATAVGTPAVTLGEGEVLGFDFDPVADRARVVSNGGQNFRLNPDDGTLIDGDVVVPGIGPDQTPAFVVGDPHADATPQLVGAAYSNNTAGATATTLFAIDDATASLVRVGSVDGTPDSPNGGGVATVGALNLPDVSAAAGFDIEPTTGVAYASLAISDRARSGLYTFDLTTGATTLIGQIRGSKRPAVDIAIVPKGDTVHALDKKNRLFTFDSSLPNVAARPVRITGLARKERLLSLDVRPATSVVYAFSNQNRLYTVDPATGLATAAGGQTAVPLDRKGLVDIDFNPAVDAIRVVNNRGENLRLDPLTGQIVDTDTVLAGVQFDVPLAYASTDANATRVPSVSGVAYTNSSFVAPATTTLYAIDAAQDVLATIGTVDGTTSPNTGQMFTVGSLGLNVSDPSSFDIAFDGTTNAAYASFKAKGQKLSLYTIDLATGAATPLGTLGKGVSPVSIAVVPPLTAPTPIP